MTAQTTNIMLRNDTILGVCEAIGTDFGINPNWLRVAFCAPVVWNPVVSIGAYLGLGLVVAATRYAFPDRKAEIGRPAPAAVIAAKPAAASEERQPELIAA